MKKMGKLTTNGVIIEKHEFRTVEYFLLLGKNISLIPISNRKNVKTPDFVMDDIDWEVKCPISTNRKTIEKSFHQAMKQSCNLICDLRRLKTSSDLVERIIVKAFQTSSRAKRLKIITKSNHLLEYEKQP
ncbi:hypothetical protein IJJ08_05355 [bacterium]|nr:hypothetical protein [bacterium]